MGDFGANSHFEPEQCRALVQRILSSPEFQRAPRLRDFLVYVVERKLEDAPGEVTEVLVGQRVFGRPAGYNPGEDSIVRTEARILRQRLDRYFTGEGRNEPLLLEIPKGSYLPAFRNRAQPGEKVTKPAGNQRFWIAGILVLTAGLGAWRVWVKTSSATGATHVAQSPTAGRIELDSSDPRLVRSFRWAKQSALSRVYTGDPIGDWYDSSREPDRHAFCIRDLSHQSVGAAALGLSGHTRNMLHRYAASISAGKDWAGLWEINKDGFPAPNDYEDDGHFRYCLPGNFDAMQACYRQFLWTGDASYFDAVFSNFYDRSVTNYVAAWDLNRDGGMGSPPEAGRRGIPSYYQSSPRPLTGADLLAAQYKGYLVYAAMQESKGTAGSLSRKLAEEYRGKAQALRLRFDTEWWDARQNRYRGLMLPDRTFFPGYVPDPNAFALLFGITAEGLKTEAALDLLEKNRPESDQIFSYYPEILFTYGRNESAYRTLLEIADPNFRSQGIPEVAFAVLGAATTGLAGIAPDAPRHTLETFSHLPPGVEWVNLSRVPVLQNEVSVHHGAVRETSVTNQSGPKFMWKASFPAGPGDRTPQVTLDGQLVSAAIEQRVNGQSVVTVLAPVQPGETRTIRYSSGTQ
jgi:hypothetical protein